MTKEKGDTAQLQFWRGDFGNSYIDRNAASTEHLRARVAMWAKIMVPMSATTCAPFEH
jgi:hypothetical protein